ncbi:MAG: hypothetical protein M1837_003754 [Sclerophora amabilis]|nr:MAG: hypothetical protein M1837_003754 [Sclerophora amabilis]
MAYRQPTIPVRQRTYSTQDQPQTSTQSPELQPRLEESQEWVLFSPTAPSTFRSETISSERTPRTAGLSHFSDYGSVEPAVGPSEGDEDAHHDQIQSERVDLYDRGHTSEDEEEELDSLDSHLHAFREPSDYRLSSHDQSGGILPTHDGLGMFPASSNSVQEQLYSFEQFNPHRRRRRSSSVIKAAELEEADQRESQRMARIQDWQMEQSRIVLDEIEKETRRRRMSKISERSIRGAGADEEDRVTMAVSEEGDQVSVQGNELIKALRKQGLGGTRSNAESEDEDSLWRQITRRIIRDFMGINDSVLSVIFGESLPEGFEAVFRGSTPMPGAISFDHALASSQPSWHDRLIERIARELGVLVHQLSNHPGAFSTYLRTQQAPDFVGSTTPTQHTILPHVESADSSPLHGDSQSLTSRKSSIAGPQFSPTIPYARSPSIGHAELWGVDEGASTHVSAESARASARRAEAERMKFEREYWERELDISMIFSFLKNRFRRRRHTHQTDDRSHGLSAPASTSTTTGAAARAAVIRQHHPLVPSRQPIDNPRRNSGPVSAHHQHHHQQQQGALLATHLKRKNSSCASQSSNKSRRGRAASGSSRNYWDPGSSMGASGSTIASMGGLGTWGEV